MNELQVFQNDEFGEVRTVLIDGEPWFVGKDVGIILKYLNPQKAIRDHVDVVDRTVNESFTVNGTPITLINESGLYSLILSSKLPNAKNFKHWVTSKILPSIRKFGGYVTDDTIKNIFHDAENLNIFLQNMLKISDKNIELAGKIETLEPKAEYFDQMMNSGLSTNFRTTAKEMGIKPMCFIGFLLDEKYLFRNTKNVLLPYQKFVNSGLFELVEFVRNNHKGVQTLVTPKGRAYFLKEYFR